MRRSWLISAAVVLLIGLTFFGQGIGLLGGSQMSGSAFWAAVGAVCVVAALAFLFVERRRGARV